MSRRRDVRILGSLDGHTYRLASLRTTARGKIIGDLSHEAGVHGTLPPDGRYHETDEMSGEHFFGQSIPPLSGLTFREYRRWQLDPDVVRRQPASGPPSAPNCLVLPLDGASNPCVSLGLCGARISDEEYAAIQSQTNTWAFGGPKSDQTLVIRFEVSG